MKNIFLIIFLLYSSTSLANVQSEKWVLQNDGLGDFYFLVTNNQKMCQIFYRNQEIQTSVTTMTNTGLQTDLSISSFKQSCDQYVHSLPNTLKSHYKKLINGKLISV